MEDSRSARVTRVRSCRSPGGLPLHATASRDRFAGQSLGRLVSGRGVPGLVRLFPAVPVELDGGARSEAKKFAVEVAPAAITVRVPR